MKAALAAGKHVVCEKPLAMTAARVARSCSRSPSASGLVHCTNFNIRFYPLVQEARARVQAGELGEVWNVHGGYLQDWLLLPTDWNWRLEPEQGGELRAVADIGSHWLDLVQFVTGLRDRGGLRRPGDGDPGPAAADRRGRDVRRGRRRRARRCADGDGGRRPHPHAVPRRRPRSCVVSQVSAGRKNAVGFEVDGSRALARLGR